MVEQSSRTDPGEIRQRFPNPRTLAESSALALSDKVRALLDWKQDLLELQKAGEENMLNLSGRSDVASQLMAVSDALIFLGHKSD
jgi:hypothetical protein